MLFILVVYDFLIDNIFEFVSFIVIDEYFLFDENLEKKSDVLINFYEINNICRDVIIFY